MERNLDIQSRRLQEIEDLVRVTLDDQEPAIQLTRGPRQQTYDELTTFNDEVRTHRKWTEVNLDSALTEQQRQGWESAGKRLPIDYIGPGFGGAHTASKAPDTTSHDRSKRSGRSWQANSAEPHGMPATPHR